jgi:hypothetical protein
MTGNLTAYGRVRGEIKCTYHGKPFDKDWNGVFTASEIIAWSSKAPEPIPNYLTDGPEPFGKVGELTQNVTKEILKDLLRTFFVSNTKLTALLISARITHWYKNDEELSSRFLKLPSDAEGRIMALTQYLSSIDLNTWGVLLQIDKALEKLEAQEKDCDSMNFFFTF